MQLQNLRLTGFKSFVEPTELEIEAGLTGIVGPNGCGKSNLVEALRWVMGESSAKQLRGGEMDDVIFGGTTSRPARSFAEVVLRLRQTAAMPGDGGSSDVEVSRRITRGDGSIYRMNGREVRARDVQLLFADAATGARSAAMVSQGQIGTLIAAKPEQRRAILEEAAGITGLHARRHEAEQRLHAASLNLERVDDVLTTLDGQLQSLKKQARQTSRYKTINERLRRAEAALFFAKWKTAEARLGDAERGLSAAEQTVEAATRAAAAAAAGNDRAAEALPALRRKETEAKSALQRLQVDRDMLNAERQRIADEQRSRQALFEQARRDLERETSRAADAATTMQRLDQERSAIVQAQVGEDAAIEDASRIVTTVEGELAELEKQAASLAEAIARNEARRAALQRQTRETEERVGRIRRQREQVQRDRAAADRSRIASDALAAAESAASLAEAAAGDANREADAAAEAAIALRERSAEAREAAQQRDMELARLRSEEKTLADLLAAETKASWTPILESVVVEPGFEAALGAALGEDLAAGAQPTDPVHWRALDPYEDRPALPAGAEPLQGHIQGPSALDRRLAQIGVVEDRQTGDALSAELLPGQRLVTREGAFWRWDGLTSGPERTTATATRLTYRNRLRVLRREIPAAEAAASAARADSAAALEGLQQALKREKTGRDTAREAQANLTRRHQELAQLKQRAAVQESQLSAILETEQRVEAELAAAEASLAGARDGMAELADVGMARAEAAATQSTIADARNRLLDARGRHDRQQREAVGRARRLEAIDLETASWTQRQGDATTQIQELHQRVISEEAALARLSELPADIESRRAALVEQIDVAESICRAATSELAAAETASEEHRQKMRNADVALAAAREARVRTEAALENARASAETLATDIQHRFGQPPATLGDLRDEDVGDAEALEQRLARLLRERDAIGPVNLRADVEIETTTAEIDDLIKQRDDLTAAIAKLRAGIAELSREARGRLVVAFEQVDGHFRRLFTKLFGGGRAELVLTDTDDPLAAGLEILASPPGKRLENLALMSGGERALAALSLILAVFLTQPAPICVLDEVDAPLDEANVDRFCNLIEEISETTGTRFLVVTHHGLTMARMHRLFGVTMSERGVSQLVSVDLQVAEELRATA